MILESIAFFASLVGVGRVAEKRQWKKVERTRKTAHAYVAPVTQGNAAFVSKANARKKGWV